MAGGGAAYIVRIIEISGQTDRKNCLIACCVVCGFFGIASCSSCYAWRSFKLSDHVASVFKILCGRLIEVDVSDAEAYTGTILQKTNKQQKIETKAFFIIKNTLRLIAINSRAFRLRRRCTLYSVIFVCLCNDITIFKSIFFLTVVNQITYNH